LLGLFFNYKAIVESSILWQPGAPLETWIKYLDHVFKLAKDNVWIRDKCGVLLCEAITSLRSNDQKEQYVKPLLDRLVRSGLAKTAEGVAVWLTASAVCDDSVLPHGVWRHDDPLCTAERQSLVKILKGSSVEDESANGSGDHKSASGFAMPTPSFAWDIVLRTELGLLEDRKDARETDFAKFWLDVVDSKCFWSCHQYKLNHSRQSVLVLFLS
jgi:DNA polymerase phi